MTADSTEVKRLAEDYRELSPSQVALALASLSRHLQRIQDEQGPLEEAAVKAREDYILAHAKAFLDQSGSVEEKKQRTLWVTHDERLAAELAETLVKMHIAQIATLRKRIDIARSAAALVRAEWELGQVGGRARGG